jgi:hypothetical protein
MGGYKQIVDAMIYYVIKLEMAVILDLHIIRPLPLNKIPIIEDSADIRAFSLCQNRPAPARYSPVHDTPIHGCSTQGRNLGSI